jgi:hypothetical protein
MWRPSVHATFTVYKMPMHSFCRIFLSGFFSMFLLMMVATSDAQVVSPVTFPFPGDHVSLSASAVYTLCKEDVIDYKTLAGSSFLKLPPYIANKTIRLTDTVESIWIYFVIKNTLAVDTSVLIKTGGLARRSILYRVNGQTLEEAGRSGLRMPYSQLTEKDPLRIRLVVKAKSVQPFYFRQQRYGPSAKADIPDLQTETQALTERYNWDQFMLPQKNFTLLLLGFHVAFFLFGAVKYNKGKNDKAYLWFSLTNIFSFIFIAADISLLVFDFFLWDKLNQADYFLFFNIVATLCYLQFQIEFLGLKSIRPGLVKAANNYSVLLAVAGVLTMLADQLNIFPAAFNITRAMSHGLLVFFILMFLHVKNNREGVNRYIFYGMLSWLVGIAFYVPYIWLDLKRYLPPLIRGNFIMGVPAAIEFFFFMKALVYRDQETERQKIQIQQELIGQLKRNEALQQSFTRELENQVKERTSELLEQRKNSEQQREEKLRLEFEQKFSESELKALRSQINPHFIFNVLNTIESFTLESNTTAASDMIQKFSRLTRLVLENSLHLVVPIEKDLQALKLYIELEQIRYQNKFTVEFDVNREIFEENYFIPPMIIQPYVENAILHGLRNLPETGNLRLAVFRQAAYLKITVEDNGIGRAKSGLLKEDNVIQRTSIGMSVTQDRISIFNNLSHHNKASVYIHDLEKGTRVELLFPAELA